MCLHRGTSCLRRLCSFYYVVTSGNKFPAAFFWGRCVFLLIFRQAGSELKILIQAETPLERRALKIAAQIRV